MIVRLYSNIDIIQGINRYGNAVDGITDWRIENTANGVFNILNSSSTTPNISIIENGNVGIGTIPITASSKLEVFGDVNTTGIYRKNNRDVITDTSNYVLTTSNLFVSRIIEEVGYGSNYVNRIASQLNTRVMNTSNYIATLSSGVGVGTGVTVSSVNSQWTNVSSGIYYTPTPSLAITSSPSATLGATGDYTYMVFTYTTETAGAGTGQSLYTITVPTGGVGCDILMVGGGGGGDQINAGGGGGGAVLYATNITIPSGSYTIKVGKGGVQNVNGSSSEAFGAICLGGGSTPYVAWNTPNNGTAGGSGSGGSPGSWSQSITGFGGGVGISTKGTLLNSGTLYNGNIGGNGIPQVSGTGNVSGGGGGGAGSPGLTSSATQYSTRSSWISGGKPSSGGDGIQINITGTGYYWGAGGGGGGTSTHAGDGGLGGGGGGGITGSPAIAGLAGTGGINNGVNGNVNGAFVSDGGNGAPNSGSGGGGGGDGGSGGTGGSGVVILRFLSSTRNVGIGTINPTSELHVYDDTTINTKLTVQNNNAGNPDIVITPSSGFTNVITRSGTPVKTYITYTFSFNQDNLIAYYKFNGNYNDNNPSTTKYNLTATGSPEFISTETNFIQDSSVYLNTSVEFLATSDNFPNTFGTSYSFWFKRTNNSTHDMLFAIGTDFFLVAHTVNKLYFSNTVGGNETYGQPSITWENNIWYHCVFIFLTDGTWKIYINGNELIVSTLGGNYPFTVGNGKMPTGKLYIGGKNVGYWAADNLDGYIDEFYVFNKVLTSVEIINLYNKNYTPPTNTWNVKVPTSSAVVINGGSSQNVAGNYTVSVSNNSSVIPADGQAIIPYPSTATTSVAIMYEYNRTLLPEVITTASGTTTRRIGDTDLCTTFTYNGTGTATTYTFAIAEPYICDILIVGGGGAGGGNGGGGGGASGYVYISNITLTPKIYTLSVGRGGTGVLNANTNGINSSFIATDNSISYTSLGGGFGGSRGSSGLSTSGGSGGGGGGISPGVGQTSTQFSTYGYGVGFAGANGFDNQYYSAGGGGGGAGSNGTVAISGLGGNGGNGIANSITGTNVIYCAGGGGGVSTDGSVTGRTGVNGSNGNGSFGSGSLGGGVNVGSLSGKDGIIIIRYRRINSSSLELITTKQLPNEIVVLGTTSSLVGADRCILFPYTVDTIAGTGQTQYTFTTTENLICDILVVGGGGGGGFARAGGGGSGALILSISNLLSGTYTVKIGNGGAGDTNGYNGINGYDSEIINSIGTVIFRAKGGGGGGSIGGPDYPANDGGSGGGARSQNGGLGGNPVSTNIVNGITTGPIVTTTYGVYGNRGGRNVTTYAGNLDTMDGAGGGGIGQGGSTSGSLQIVDSQFVANNGGNGGDGLYFTTINGVVYNFKNYFNVNGIEDGTTGNFYIGGGGGGGDTNGGTAGIGGKGGGGGGGENSVNGIPASGIGSGGGGGAGSGGTLGGKGSAGIVIIRYRRITGLQGYNIGNYNGDFKIVSSSYSSSTSTEIDFLRITKDGASIYNPTGTPLWSTISDRRIKQDIEKASYDKCYDNINKLDLYRFSYIKELNNINKDLKQLGYIAQEVKNIFPKAVSTQEFHNDNLSISDMLSIDITQINYSLYGAVKKLIEIDNNKDMRLKMIEYLVNIDKTSNVILEDTSMTSNVILDTSMTSNVILEDTSMTSNVILEDTSMTSNVILEDTSMTSNVILEDTSMTSNVILDTSMTSNVTLEDTLTSNVILEDTSMTSNV